MWVGSLTSVNAVSAEGRTCPNGNCCWDILRGWGDGGNVLAAKCFRDLGLEQKRADQLRSSRKTEWRRDIQYQTSGMVLMPYLACHS